MSLLKFLLKIFLVLFILVFGVASFCGYHIYRAISLDDYEIKFGVTDGHAATALNFFEASLASYEGISADPGPEHLGIENFTVSQHLGLNSVAYDHRKFDKLNSSEYRYEKYKLTGALRDKWGEGSVFAKYHKTEDGWFNATKTMTVESGDSTIVLVSKNFYGERDELYVTKKSGPVSSHTGCVWDGNQCTDSIVVYQVEVDPVSGKKLRSYRKDRQYYSEGSLVTSFSKSFDEIKSDTTEYIYDDLDRLVELRMSDMTYHFIHNTRDTANLDVKIYGTPAVLLAHYQRTRKGNQEVVHIETREYDKLVTKTFEDGHLVKSEMIDDEFYREYQVVVRTYDAAGNILTDSLFLEDRMPPGIREHAESGTSYYKYGKNGKVLSVEHVGYEYKRQYPIALFPLEGPKSSEKMDEQKYGYDSQDRLVSYEDENRHEIKNVTINHDVAEDSVKWDFSTCRVPRSIEKLEWNKISDLFSISPDGKYRKQLECEVANKTLICKDAYYKWTSRALDRVASDESFWEKCSIYLDHKTIIDGHKKGKTRDSLLKENYALVSAPLTKDSMIYLNELMLASGIELDSILCDGCQIENKKGKRGESYSSFTCKLGMDIYEFKAAEKNILNEVSVFYGNPKNLPDCLVGFAHSSGIVLGMSKHSVGGVKLPFMKTDNEWGYFEDYPVYGGWGDSRNLRLRFTKDKLCNYRATRFID